MFSRRLAVYSILPTMLCSYEVLADPVFTGATGALSVPNAEIAQEGKFSYQYNNFGESHLVDNYDKTRNHIINLGVSSHVEISGRLTDYVPEGDVFNSNGTRKGKRDLSGNIKVRLPQLHEALPEFAIGANDIAGEAVNFSSQYVVGSKKVGNATVSAGYAVGDNPSFNGEFASVQYKATPYLELDVEYDTQDTRLGGRYDLGRLGLPASVQASVPLNRGNDNSGAFVGVTFHNNLKSSLFAQRKQSSQAIPIANQRSIALFTKKLARDYQLERLQQGRTKEGTLVVAVEQAIYNHNILDAIAIVYGVAHELLPDNEKALIVILKDNGIAKLATKTSMSALRGYFSDNKKAPDSFIRQWQAWYPSRQWLAKLSGLKNLSSAPKTRLDIKVQPSLRTAIGTEWGAFDYSAAIKATANVNTWKGGKLSASWDAPLKKTPLYESGHVYDELAHTSGFQELVFHQEVKPTAQTLGLVSVGKTTINNHEYKVAQLEGGWKNYNGTYSLSGKVAGYQDEEKRKHELALVQYQHHWHHKDINAKVTYGKFFGQDKGVHVGLGKDFGNAQLKAYVKYISNEDMSGGMQVVLPLSPRRDYKKNGVVVRGNESWRYAQETTIKDPIVVGSNRIRHDMLLDPILQHSHHAQGLSKGRLSPEYIKAHIHNLKPSYNYFKK